MSVQISHKSAYAPIRYQSTRPWWKTLGKMAAEVVRIDGDFARNDHFRKTFLPAVHKAFIIEARIHPADREVIDKELGLLSIKGRFIRGGRAIYDFSERLTDNLLMTDFSDTTIGDVLKSDLDIYIHFGAHPGLNLENTQYEGAWIEYLYEKKHLNIWPAKANSFKSKPTKLSDDDSIDGIDYIAHSDEQTIASMFDGTMAQVRNAKNEMLDETSDIIDDLAERTGIDPSDLIEDLFPNIDEFSKAFESIHSSIFNICMSALCYLNAKPEETSYGWPKDAPVNMVAQAMNKKDAGRRATAQTALENDGYIKIGYVGARYNTMSSEPRLFTPGQSASEIKHIKSTHPRRGFFRRQRVGQGRKDIKVVYVTPTMVNSGNKIGAGKVFAVK